jgi:hypothetical protein
MNKLVKLFVLAFVFGFLVGCGSGDDDSESEDGLPSVNVFDYALFPKIDIVGALVYMEHKTIRYFEDNKSTYDFMDDIANKANCNYTSDYQISCDYNYANITGAKATRGLDLVTYGYFSNTVVTPTEKLLADIFIPSDALILGISNYYLYKGNLSSQLKIYAEELVNKKGFTKIISMGVTKWQKKEGHRTYTWDYGINSLLNTSSVTWDIKDVDPEMSGF